ncbi:MAG: hypothetical protein U0N17_07485 [Agathobaculum butyriciproducens]
MVAGWASAWSAWAPVCTALRRVPAQDREAGTAGVLTGSVAGLPVHNRRLTLDFSAGDGSVSLVGLWSFGTPYTTANGISITCSAADALLQFAAESGETGTIESMTAGYRMQTDSSRRIRLTPTWKIDTETGEYLVDCDKKTIIGEEN